MFFSCGHKHILSQYVSVLRSFSCANNTSSTMTFGIYACKSLKLIQAKHHDKPRHNQRVYYALRFFPLHDEPGHDSLGTCSLLCSFTRPLEKHSNRTQQFIHNNINKDVTFTLLTSLCLTCFLRIRFRACFFFSSAFILERLGLYMMRVRPI